MTLRVGLDVSNALTHTPSGVARYIHRLVTALADSPAAPHLVLYCRPSRRRHGSPHGAFPGHEVRWLNPWRSPRDIDLFHGPDLRLPRSWHGPTVVTIHDLTALDGHEHASARFLSRKRHGYQLAAQRAHAIVTHTQAIRAQVIQRLGVAPPKVHVALLAAGTPATLPSAANPPQPRSDWLLVVGGPSRRKGAQRIVDLLDLWESRLDWRPTVRWVGSASAAERAEFHARLPPHLRPRTQLLGHVSDSTLTQLYQTAMGLLVLSDHEGFALPLVEAAEQGCPVLGLASAPLTEVLPPDGAWWFREPFASSRDVFSGFLDPQRRHERAQCARTRARTFSWEATARATLAAYHAALAEAGARPGMVETPPHRHLPA